MYNGHMPNSVMYNSNDRYWFVNCSETVGSTDVENYSLTRTLTEFIFVTDSLSKQTSKLFMETIRLTPWLTIKKSNGQSPFTEVSL